MVSLVLVLWGSDIVAVEAMPSELVRQFTLLREVDAKYSGLSLYGMY